MSAISVDHVSMSFETRRGRVTALDDVSIVVPRPRALEDERLAELRRRILSQIFEVV